MNRLSVCLLIGAVGIVLLLATCNGSVKPIGNEMLKPFAWGILTANHYTVRIHKISVELSNLSDSDLQFYLTPAKYDYYNDSMLLSTIVSAQQSEKEKAIALYQFVYSQQSFSKPESEQSKLLHQPARFLQSFGSGQCDDASSVLCALAIESGLKARLYHLSGHLVAEIFYSKAWHMFDANNGICIKDDGGEILSVEQIEKDPSVISRTDFKQSGIFFALAKFRLKQTISSTKNNRVDNWLLSPNSDYTSTINLGRHERITFNVFPQGTNSLLRWLKLRPDNAVDVRGDYAKTIGMAEWEKLVAVNLPYAIKKVELRSLGFDKGTACKVYYSPNQKDWFFKGMLQGERSSIRFATADENGIPFVFKYWLKLVPLGAHSFASLRDVEVVSDFIFSEKQFLSNFNDSLCIRSLSGSNLQDLDVCVKYVP